MNLQRKIAIAVALAIVSTSALAFQEQQGAPPAATAPAANAGEPQQPTQELNLPPPAAKQDGTVVTIPGLGQLGVLPKMDFGLELLYGANDEPKVENEPNPQLPADELTIRGSVKKSF